MLTNFILSTFVLNWHKSWIRRIEFHFVKYCLVRVGEQKETIPIFSRDHINRTISFSDNTLLNLISISQNAILSIPGIRLKAADWV